MYWFVCPILELFILELREYLSTLCGVWRLAPPRPPATSPPYWRKPYKDALDQQKFHPSQGIFGQIHRLVREILNQERISKFAEFIC